VAQFYGLSTDQLIEYKPRFGKLRLPDGRYDYRLDNAYIPEIEYLDLGKPLKIDHIGNEIYVVRESVSVHQTTIYDYSKYFWEIINKYSLRYQSKDCRESIYVDTTHHYALYRVALANHLYCGLPSERNALIEAMKRFEEEYGKDLVVDHLDGNCLNCRTNNLMLMSNSQNVRKAHLQQKLRKMGKADDFQLSRCRRNDMVWVCSPQNQINEEMGIDDMLDFLAEYISFQKP
jgi:hypothetical protein